MTNVTAGVVMAIVQVVLAVSFAALIFSGELSIFVNGGIGLMLVGAAIIIGIMALLSSSSHVVGSVQDGPAVVLSLIAAAIVATMPPGATAEETFLTVVAAIALSTLLTGLFFLALGYFRSGGLVRFIPYPVIGGFLAGAGWLLVLGSLGIMTGFSGEPGQIAVLFQPGSLARWLPGLLYAIVLLIVMRRVKHALTIPAMIVGAIALFYLVAQIGGSSIAELSAQGWLLGPFPNEGLYRPLLPSDLSMVSWSTIFGQAGNMATIVIISVVGLLLNASALELLFQKDMDFNRELRAAGVANIFSGLVSSAVGFHGLVISTLGFRIKGTGRLAAIVVAIVCALTFFFGGSLLSLIPKFILGGLMIYLGLSFLLEWVYEAWYRLPRLEYFVVILILVVIATVGFVQGVVVGLVASLIFFVLNYSRTNVVRHALSGASFKSRMTRETIHQQVLAENEERLYILQLQGFIFFGTANTLLDRVRDRILDPERPRPLFVLLDFRQVTGLDSTAILSFTKMKQLAEDRKLVLVFSHMSPQIRAQFEAGGLKETDGGRLSYCPDVDYALEWCENRILEMAGMEGDTRQATIEDHLELLLPEGSDVQTLIDYLEPLEIAAGDYLMRQGDPPDNLYFVESGQVTALLEFPDRESVRLESMRGGHVVGELGFYLGIKRTASVVADEPSRIFRLTAQALERMHEDNKDAALAFQQFIIELLAERVAHLVGTVDILRR